MKKVLIITYYWPPSGGPGVQRWVKFVKYLSRLGAEPIVLTVNPKYATYPQIDESLANDITDSVKVFQTKSFDFYSYYKKISPNKEVPYGGFANTKKVNFKEKALRFIRGNFVIPDPRRGWNKYAISKSKEIIKEYNISTVITTSPPHSTQLIGLKLKKQLGIRWIADFRDPWTDIFYFKDLYPTKIATRIHKSLEKKVLNKSDKIITVSHDLKRLFSEIQKDQKDNILVIPNGFDTEDFPITKVNKTRNFFTISYVGTISKEYDIDGFIDGLKQLPPELLKKIRIRFVGKLLDEFYKKLNQALLTENIEIIGYVDHDKAIRYMIDSDVLLLIIPRAKNNKGILTGKLFEYMASNCPILFIGPEDGDAAEIIRETNSGIICNYDDSNKIGSSIYNLYKQSKNPNTEITVNSESSKYSRENLTKKLIEIL